ncbi:DNA mismatch repair endonuclease MutL [Desulfotomaculum sp. 1211_IL3151]|uniref:DNA mismatch repair endonuclease MutL n=1 Tax=Desulfotomaculum sp. 1211_IL3151 TaxID=3084055 RepID=UPI002FDB013B
MASIILLDEFTANKIAAGEVVERPVSVVKELVENGLDAGATRIIVELIQGGLTSIKVVDNGSGMSGADAELCFQRHATSKIKAPEDLSSILTLGFRGEALPSIAAVAKVTLTTRTANDLAGTTVQIEGGLIQSVTPVGCPIGTTIDVKELFYNTPARRKFLKSANAETSQVSDLLTRLAMARPDVRFELYSGKKQLFASPGKGSLKDAVAVIYGLDNVRSMLEVNYQGNLVRVAGLISKPVLTRATRHYQNFFLNGRYIRSGFLSSIIQRSFETLIPPGRFPIAVLRIDVDPNQVDVNVHPTKMEVRLAREKEIEEELMEALCLSLNAPEAITGLWEMMPGRNSPPQTEAATAAKEEAVTNREPADPKVTNLEQPIKTEAPKYDQGQLRFNNHRNISAPLAKQSFFPREQKETLTQISQPRLEENKSPYQTETAMEFPDLTPLGQLPPTYLLAHGVGGLYIIDQHAAHERVLYEKYLDLLSSNVEAQMLLEPLALELPHHEAQLIVQHIVELNEIGFILEHFGGDTFLLRGAPTNAIAEAKEVFLDLLARLQGGFVQKIDKNKVIDQLAAAMACRDAAKAGQSFNALETKALLDGLTQCQKPYTCPHGRPTLIQISQEELKKRFKR